MKLRKYMNTIKQNDKGFTMIELLISVMLLALIAGAFLHTFVYSTRTNISSGAIMGESYIAQTCMEEIYTLSLGREMEELKNEIVLEGFTHTNVGLYHEFKKEIDGYYVMVQVIEEAYASTSPKLTKVVVQVYDDITYTNMVAIVQNIITL